MAPAPARKYKNPLPLPRYPCPTPGKTAPGKIERQTAFPLLRGLYSSTKVTSCDKEFTCILCSISSNPSFSILISYCPKGMEGSCSGNSVYVLEKPGPFNSSSASSNKLFIVKLPRPSTLFKSKLIVLSSFRRISICSGRNSGDHPSESNSQQGGLVWFAAQPILQRCCHSV
jgi:hypothetical protein